MAKRKQPEPDDDEPGSRLTPKKIKSAPTIQVDPVETPSKLRSILKVPEIPTGDLTPRSVRKVLFSEPATPKESSERPSAESPITKANRLDSSARRKSSRRLFERNNDDEDDDIAAIDERALAQEILDDDNDVDAEDGIVVNPDTPTKATSTRDRPKGRRKERSLTPPDDLTPHELYFFQNRTGASKTSSNALPANALLSHEDYFARIKTHIDPHLDHLQHLSRLHQYGFDQWMFELESGFSICLYGYGSKRQLVTEFASHIHHAASEPPMIVMVNGYNPALAPKDILSTLAARLFPPSAKLPSQPGPLTEAIFSQLGATDSPRIYLVVHSLDAPPLRKPSTQSMIARIASHPLISLLATVDNPTFALLWPLPILSQFRFLYHDTTTFRPYDAEIDTVDEVNALLGRSGRRVGGKDGVTFVLRSLPENARNLFRILVAEQLSLIDAGVMSADMAAAATAGSDEDDETLFDDADDMDVDVETPSKRGRGRKAPTPKKKKPSSDRQKEKRMLHGVEYRALYRKAVEEFVCSSEIGFRTLLKEFHDHQIVESVKDGALGEERLVVPFGKADLEVLLEELI